MALHVAAREGNVVAIRKLVAHGARLDERNGAGSTPTLCALNEAHLDSVWLLLELGSNPDAPGEVCCDKGTQMLLQLQAYRRHCRITKLSSSGLYLSTMLLPLLVCCNAAPLPLYQARCVHPAS